eukprot:TRINITY_DN44145_c0_g1_i1.p1 TRINITY_DN44145_c0_g1~~TRINITY_DN44145_c0_g1_i1.p1  ORF type:complete len:922 (-),score=161.74 TRINITY_DN44145_c0_g1_i1:84-2762(-)
MKARRRPLPPEHHAIMEPYVYQLEPCASLDRNTRQASVASYASRHDCLNFGGSGSGEADGYHGLPATFGGIRAPVAAVLTLVFLMQAFLGDTDVDTEFNRPKRIIVQEKAPDLGSGGSSATGSVTPPQVSLRGCCGEPTEFRWVFLDGNSGATAGAPFRTRVFAVDAQGRQARPSACEGVRVDLGLSGGRARLSPATSPPRWQGAELWLDIECDARGLVEAEVRIASPDPDADVLLHTSRIVFASGPAHSIELRIRRKEDASDKYDADRDSSEDPDGDEGPWPEGAELEAFVTLLDRFGNSVSLGSAGAAALLGTSLGANVVLTLRVSAELQLQAASHDGRLHIDSQGRGRALFRAVDGAETAEIWLEPSVVGSSIADARSMAQQRSQLRNRTLRTVRFKSAEILKGPPAESEVAVPESDARWAPVAAEVKDAFLHGWNGYKKHAWGRDELQPISRIGRDSFGGIGMTILDSLTTLWLMGLKDEFDEATSFVQDTLDFTKAEEEVSVFELIIRALGGLLGAHALSGKDIFLEKAKDLGIRLLPALNTPSKLPLPKFSLSKGTGRFTSEPTILAEAGSLQLEYRYLARQTGNRSFREASDATFEAIRSAGVEGLMPVYLSQPQHTPVQTLDSKFAVGALTDSYYEYLLKQWLQSPDEVAFRDRWLTFMNELPTLMVPKPTSKKIKGKPPKYKVLEQGSHGTTMWKMDHLSCFAPGMIALGLQTLTEGSLADKSKLPSGFDTSWWNVAKGLLASCVDLWTSSNSGLAPEFAYVHSSAPYAFSEVPEAGKHSFLRPETAESLFYLYRFTRDEQYREWGEKIFRAIVTHAKVDAGFASVEDVKQTPTVKLDEMQSFVMAETFKYLYLLFSPDDALDLRQYVLNTEGHPLPRGNKSS